jgi:hypothetical protein
MVGDLHGRSRSGKLREPGMQVEIPVKVAVADDLDEMTSCTG